LTLLIDPPNSQGHGRLWSHLASDESFDELHRFAEGLGIPPRGFDRDHYDIPAERYERVVAAGATPVSSRELIDRLRRAGLRRRKGQPLAPRKPGRTLARAERLRVGDRVAVVAPAGPVTDSFDEGLGVLQSWGLDVRVAKHVRGRHERFGYLAAGDAARAGDLMRAWCDPSVRAVFCARGGYGAQRIVDLLDWEAIAAAGTKALVGFSDVTALHQAFSARVGMSTIHGPVVTSLGAGDNASREHLRSMLFSPAPDTTITPVPARTVVGGRAEGVLVGGNVALLAAGVGAEGSQSAADSIAVLEDVGEELYRLDRLLTQLLRSGWFDGVRGIALGQFTACGSPEQAGDLLLERLGPLGVPMVGDVPVGHGDRNLAFPFGVPAALDADAGTLVLREPALLST
jgi:muramoyltetrapeptide carboxypeptidase